MQAIILAAGEGMRLRPLTTYMPKVMLPVGNKPIMEYVIESLRKNYVKDIKIVVGYKADMIKQYFGNGSDFGVHIDYVEQKKQLGTAHALYQAKVNGEFLLLYGDNMVDERCVKELINSKRNTILGAYSKKPFRYGVIESSGHKLVKIKEKLPKEGALVFTGMAHLDGKIFDVIEDKMKEGIYNLPDILNYIGANIKVVDCGWRDAIFPLDLLDLNSYALRRNVRKLAGKIEEATIIGNVEIGENSRIGAGSYIKGNVKIGEDCDIGPNTVIIGDTSIGDGVSIGSFSHIENSIIMGNTHIDVGAIIKNSVIGREVFIAPRFTTISGKSKRILDNEVVESEGGAVVGDGAIIGSSVVVHPGVNIGSNSKIADNKILKEDVLNGESVR